MEARGYMSDYEGREEEPESEPLNCGSCGQPGPELKGCTWDRDLMVGECCRVHPEVCEACNRDHEDCRCFPLTLPADVSRPKPRTVGAVPIKEVA